ncbi:protein kinase domain-containing protein [Ditylenchus destructor]|nr:protein kinase domain-containing protein [Ditylenchus destructor]
MIPVVGIFLYIFVSIGIYLSFSRANPIIDAQGNLAFPVWQYHLPLDNASSVQYSETPNEMAPTNYTEVEDGDGNGPVENGYFQVFLGDILNGRYHIVRSLGIGWCASVWLAWDVQEKRFAAVKISTSVNNQEALEEIQFLTVTSQYASNKTTHIPKLYDYFILASVNGSYVVIVMEVLGQTLKQVIKHNSYMGLPLDDVREYTRQMLESIRYLADDCNIVHNDLKMENAMFALDRFKSLQFGKSALEALKDGKLDQGRNLGPARHKNKSMLDLRKVLEIQLEKFIFKKNSVLNGNGLKKTLEVKIADFGYAQWKNGHEKDSLQVSSYRPLEIFIDSGYNEKADVWSVACMCFEMATGHKLIPALSDPDNLIPPAATYLQPMVERLGQVPMAVLKTGRRWRKFFGEDAQLKNVTELNSTPLEVLLQTYYGWNAKASEEFSAFLRPMLDYDPNQRATAAEMLDHKWLKV